MKKLKKSESKGFFWWFIPLCVSIAAQSQESVYEQLKINRENVATWDKELFVNDSMFQAMQEIPSFVYHTPNYDAVGTFCGIGSVSFSGGEENEILLKGKHVLYNAFYTKTCVQEGPYPVFFQILLAMDEIDTVNYTHFSSQVISRNFPDILGKGFFTIHSSTIEYEALQLAVGDDIAMVNNRIFHLELGNLIVLRATSNGELFAKQVHLEGITSAIDLAQLQEIVWVNQDFLLGAE